MTAQTTVAEMTPGAGAGTARGPVQVGFESQGAPITVLPAIGWRRRHKKIIVLSLFDGIGAAPALMENMFGQPMLAMAWETHEACRKLAKAGLPWLQRRGDVTDEQPGAVAAAARQGRSSRPHRLAKTSPGLGRRPVTKGSEAASS